MSLWVKVCGVTSVADAQLVAASGVDAIGLNFVPSSKRFITDELARDIVRAVGPCVTWVAVVADQSAAELRALRERVGFDLWQLHGHEPAELLQELGADAYKALPIGAKEDALFAETFPGDRLLVDAKVTGELGGTGRVFDWQILGELPARRRIVLAGGITPDNVARAVQQVRPFGVDTASGVESAPGKKEPALVERFVREARAAQRALTAQVPDARG